MQRFCGFRTEAELVQNGNNPNYGLHAYNDQRPPTLNAHADMVSFPLLLNNICHGIAMRLAALLESHPLHQPIDRASKGVKTRPR
jgi:hypothetical protein